MNLIGGHFIVEENWGKRIHYRAAIKTNSGGNAYSGPWTFNLNLAHEQCKKLDRLMHEKIPHVYVVYECNERKYFRSY